MLCNFHPVYVEESNENETLTLFQQTPLQNVDLQKIDSHFNTAAVGSCQEFMNCKWENAIPDAFIISTLFL